MPRSLVYASYTVSALARNHQSWGNREPCWLNSLIADYYISVKYKVDYCFNYFRLTFSIISSTSPAMQYGLDNLHVRNGGIEYQHGGRKTGHLDGFNLSKTPSKCSKFQILGVELIF